MSAPLVALAGNPNVGKSTVFNALTGLRQHTGNWPGKTVELAEGICRRGGRHWRLVDLPGTYSLHPRSGEEAVAGDFLATEQPTAVVVVCDATALPRSLPLALQIMERTPRVVVCVNLLDEAAARGITVNLSVLSAELGVPVVGTAARSRRGLNDLLLAVEQVMTTPPVPQPVRYARPVREAVAALLPAIPADGLLPAPVAAREALQSEEYAASLGIRKETFAARQVAATAGLPPEKLADAITAAYILHADAVAAEAVSGGEGADRRDRRWDRVLMGRFTAWPVMGLLLAAVLWLTVSGANYLSAPLTALFGWGQEGLHALLDLFHAPSWLTGVVVDGAYAVLAWVVAVMLPPMAIFFPLFTLLEDAGYLPRIACNLDRGFRCAGTCGKQGLTMCMGLGCNAAGVVGCRILDTRRERLVAALTNSLVPCNGRFPLLITLITLFFAGQNGLLGALMLTGAVLLGVGATFLCSRLLSRVLLPGEPAPFLLELPPYRRPQVGRVLWRSLWERTLFVLARAAAVAAPAGALIWVLANVTVSGAPLLTHAAAFLEVPGRLIGLDGAILLAFILGAPANEIVLPILILTYTAGGTLQELGLPALQALLLGQGWTPLTAGCMLLFTLFHWPCTTTLLTLRRETGSRRLTLLGLLIPTVLGVLLCGFLCFLDFLL